MENISKYTMGVGLFFLCLLTMSQVLAAPKSQGEPEPPLGTWTQRGADLNSDGVLSGEENQTVFFFSGNASPVTFTLHVEGGAEVSFTSCLISIAGSMGQCAISVSNRFVPGFKQRVQHSNMGYLGIECINVPEECKFTITDVRP